MKYTGQIWKHNLDTEFWCGKTNCNVTSRKQQSIRRADTQPTVTDCKHVQTDLNTSGLCPKAELQMNTAPDWDLRARN
jgi:hypothetical protein